MGEDVRRAALTDLRAHDRCTRFFLVLLVPTKNSISAFRFIRFLRFGISRFARHLVRKQLLPGSFKPSRLSYPPADDVGHAVSTEIGLIQHKDFHEQVFYTSSGVLEPDAKTQSAHD